MTPLGDEIDRLRVENARLRDVLKDLAEELDELSDIFDDFEYGPTAKYVRTLAANARATLKEQP